MEKKRTFLLLFFLLLLSACTISEKGTNTLENANLDVKTSIEKEAQKQTEKDNADSVFLNAISTLDTAKVEAEVKAQAEANWDGDYEMQDFQYNNQMAAYHDLLDLIIDEQHKENILNHAVNTWQGDYEMIRKQYKNQLSAYQWIQELNPDNDIKKRILETAKTNWGNDYEKIRNEYEKQIAVYNH